MSRLNSTAGPAGRVGTAAPWAGGDVVGTGKIAAGARARRINHSRRFMGCFSDGGPDGERGAGVGCLWRGWAFVLRYRGAGPITRGHLRQFAREGGILRASSTSLLRGAIMNLVLHLVQQN